MSSFFKRIGAYLIPLGAGFAAGLAAAALVSRTGLVEMGDPSDETGDPTTPDQEA